MINMMCDLTVGVFEHIEITSRLDLDKRIKYIDRILRGPSLKQFRQVLLELKALKKGVVWISMEDWVGIKCYYGKSLDLCQGE